MKRYIGLNRFLYSHLDNKNLDILILYPSSQSFNKYLNTCSEPETLLDTKNTDLVPASRTLLAPSYGERDMSAGAWTTVQACTGWRVNKGN